MERLKNIFLVISEGVLFGSLGPGIVWLVLYLTHVLTYTPPNGNVSISPYSLYQAIKFPLIIFTLTISFILGEISFNSLKRKNFQWFNNIVFFIMAIIGIESYVIYYHINEMGLELNFETIDTIFNVRIDAIIILFSIFYSYLYQIFKTHVFFSPKTIC